MGINYKTLGRNIKYYRKKKNLTQEQLAETLELSVGFISQIERGITKMSLDTLICLCDSLDCSAADILNVSQTDNHDKMTDDFYALYELLPKKEKKLFYHMLKSYIEHL